MEEEETLKTLRAKTAGEVEEEVIPVEEEDEAMRQVAVVVPTPYLR